MPFIQDSSSESSVQLDADPKEERRRLHHEADVVIVGAGILGSALAVALADQGRSVILLERSLKEPDRIVGELLQPGGVEALEFLGLRDCLEDIDAIRVKGYGVIYYGDQVEIPYPDNVIRSENKNTNITKTKKQEGRSFHHGRFVRRLRAAAMASPNVTVFETNVTSVVTSTNSPQVLGVQSVSKSEKGEKPDFLIPVTCIQNAPSKLEPRNPRIFSSCVVNISQQEYRSQEEQNWQHENRGGNKIRYSCRHFGGVNLPRHP